MRRLLGHTRHGRDRAEAEVVGYVLMFGVGSIAVSLALSTFLSAKDASDALATHGALSQVADAVAGQVVRVAGMASVAPNATYAVLLTLPEAPGGLGTGGYDVTLRLGNVTVNATEIQFTARRAHPGLAVVRAAGQPLVLSGTVDAAQGVVAVEYRWDTATDRPTIELKNV